MASFLTSLNFHFVDANGNKIDVPVEWVPAYIRLSVPVDQHWSAVEVQLQGKSLDFRRHSDNTVIQYIWPRTGAGTHSLSFRIGSNIDSTPVTIRPRKISTESFSALINDLENILPTCIAIGLQRQGGMTDVRFRVQSETTLAQQIARLRRVVYGGDKTAGLIQVLTELTTSYRTILCSEEVNVRWYQARRPHPTKLAQAATQFMAGPFPFHSEVRVTDIRVEVSPDCYENQFLKAFALHVMSVARVINRILRAKDSQSELKQMLELEQKLGRAIAAATFLMEVSVPRQFIPKVTMTFLKNPIYSAVYKAFRDYRQNISVRLEDPGLEAPLNSLPALYEKWTILLICKVLIEVCKELDFEQVHQSLLRTEVMGLYVRVLPAGETVLTFKHAAKNISISLIPQRQFIGGARGTSSVSSTQIPDTVISIVHNGVESIYIFDAKYKMYVDSPNDSDTDDGGSEYEYLPKKEDIDKMHCYRDAIRGTDNTHIVKYAAILYPGQNVSYDNNSLEALRAYPGDSRELEEHIRAILTRALTV